MLGLGALKYFYEGRNPKKRIAFQSQEIIEFSRDTGPFIPIILYAPNRSILRKGPYLIEARLSAVDFS